VRHMTGFWAITSPDLWGHILSTARIRISFFSVLYLVSPSLYTSLSDLSGDTFDVGQTLSILCTFACRTLRLTGTLRIWQGGGRKVSGEVAEESFTGSSNKRMKSTIARGKDRFNPISTRFSTSLSGRGEVWGLCRLATTPLLLSGE
jgi:hypothetical protein